MRTKVVKAFFDKSTEVAYKEGEFFDGDESRVEELAKGGFVAAKIHVKETAAKQDAIAPASK